MWSNLVIVQKTYANRIITHIINTKIGSLRKSIDSNQIKF